jgi:hypothetical protein
MLSDFPSTSRLSASNRAEQVNRKTGETSSEFNSIHVVAFGDLGRATGLNGNDPNLTQ